MPTDHPLALPTQDGAFIKPVQFWMVWSKDAGPPRHTHASKAKADREAIRLAKANPGRKFIVLAATDKFWITGPQRVAGFVTAGEALPAETLAQVGAAA